MVSISKQEMAFLVQLMENEKAQNRLRGFLTAVPGKMAELDQALAEARERFSQQETALAEKKKKYREYELEVQQKQENIKKSDIKLLSIKTNKEYQAVLKEIEDLKHSASRLEDEMLEILFAIEQDSETVAAAKSEWEAEKIALEEQAEALAEEKDRQAAALAELETEWRQVAENLSAALVEHYQSVRSKVAGGNAVVAARQAVCQGCYMNIPHQLYNELAQTDTMQYCPFCHRIIYYAGQTEAAAGK